MTDDTSTNRQAPGAFRRNHPRAFAIVRVVYVVFVVVLVAELVARITTYVAFQRGIAAFPEIERRFEQSSAVYPRMTVGVATAEPERWPAVVPMDDGPPRIEPFGSLSPDAFREPLPSAAAPAGVVRVAFVGGSTTYDGYPERVGARLRERFGEARIEVVNLGIPASNTGTSLLLMRRFLPALRPNVVVVYHGFNDVVYFRARAAATDRLAHGVAGVDDPALVVMPASRGLFSLLFASEPSELPLGEASLDAIDANYEAMSALGTELGFSLWVSTFAAPSYAELDDAERAYFEAELTYLWPVTGDTDRYAADLDAYRARVREVAERRELGLIDVAGAVHGGRESFADNCHLTEAGREQQADVVTAAIAPVIEHLLAGDPH